MTDRDDEFPTTEEYVDDLLAAGRPEFDGLFRDLRDDAWASRTAAMRLIAAAQIVRDTGAVDRDAAFYLISLFAEDGTMAMIEVDPILHDLLERTRAIEAAHGFEYGDAWLVHEGPPDWQVLNEEFDRRFQELEAALLKECGEDEMATMFEVRTDEYHRRTEEGRRRYFGLRHNGPDGDSFSDSVRLRLLS